MVERTVQDPGVVIAFPTYFLVRLPEGQDPPNVVRNTLRLGSAGVTLGRQWFVPVFTTEEGASQFATDVRKIDDKLRVVPIRNYREWISLLQALHTNGDGYVAFDPLPNHVHHVPIADLLAGVRKRMPDAHADSSGRAGEPEPGRSWLRARLAAFRSGGAADGRVRTEPGREAPGTPPEDTASVHPHLTPRHRPTNPRE